MIDHPDAENLDLLAAHMNPDCAVDIAALKAGAAALRALAEFRPHHPRAVVGSRYAVLIVPHQAWLDAQKAVGAHDLGPIDLDALQAQTQADRENYYADLGAEDTRQKWGLGRWPT